MISRHLKLASSALWIILAATAAHAQSMSTPFREVPSQVPGLIQVEEFDNGGEGIAYHDVTAGNEGGAYRATDVDLQPTIDTDGGYNLGWTSAGEWLAYTVNVAATGSYTMEMRLASAAPGGNFHIEMNGVDVTGPLNVGSSRGWQSWFTATRSGIRLSAGVQVMRLVMDSVGSSGAVGNFNWVSFTLDSAQSTPYSGTPVMLPGTVEAENFDNGGEGIAYHDVTAGNEGGAYRATDVDLQPTIDTDGGYNLGWTSAGEWLAYTVNVAAAGSYTVEMRLASAVPGGNFHIEMNGVDVTGPSGVGSSRGWQSWFTASQSGIRLSAGVQVMRLVMDSVGSFGAVGNFNWIRFTLESPAAQSTPYSGTPVMLPGTVEAENFDNGGAGIAYVDQTAGNEGGAYRATDVDLQPTSDAGGGYNVGWASVHEWLNYTVNVAAAGRYTLQVRVASQDPGGTFHLEVNGVDVTGSIAVPDTGGWQTWTTRERTGVVLGAGTQTWRLVMDTPGIRNAIGNFNWFRVVSEQVPVQSLEITSPAPGAALAATAVTFRWEGAGDGFQLIIGTTPGAADVFSSGALGQSTSQYTVTGLPLSGRTLYVEVDRRIGDAIDGVRAQYTAAVRKGLAIITDFVDRRLEDWPGPGMVSVDDVSVQLRKMEDHWNWLSRGVESMRWDIIRVELPQPALPGAYPDWGAFRDAVITLARQQVRTEDYDVNGDGVIDAAWLIVSNGNQDLPFVIGGTSRNAGANLFVDGQASGSVQAGATGNFNHELGHCLGLPDMYGQYGTMSSLTLMSYSWPVPPPDFSAYERMRLGWLTPQVVSTTQDVWLPSANDKLAAVMVPTSRPSEYFLIEYRKRPASGFGSQDVDFNGLAIYHVLEGSSMSQDPPILKLQPADGRISPSQPTDPNDFFSPDNPSMIEPMTFSSYIGEGQTVFRLDHVGWRDGGIGFDITITGPQ